MSAQPGSDVSRILTQSRQGDAQAAGELLPLVYDQLRALAARYLDRERPEHTLQPTALVHEAYLRLVDPAKVDWRDRSHFFRTAAMTMRRVLVDHARARRTTKRGGDARRIMLHWGLAAESPRALDLLELDDLLQTLAALNERHAQVVELRFFGGFTIDEVSQMLGVSTTTVEDDWAMARAWLRRHLEDPTSKDSNSIP